MLNKSTIQDVMKVYGVKKIEKKWHKSVEFELLGKFEYFIVVGGVGRFSTLTRNRNKNIIKEITLDSTSLCKTKNGFGIGSTYSEAIDELGKPNVMYAESKYPHQPMKLSLNYGNYMWIRFNGTDTIKSTVEEIVLSKL